MHTTPRLRARLEAALILLLRAAFYPLPPRMASRVGAAMGWFLYHGLRLRRRAALDTIAVALGDAKDEAERRRIVAACYRHFGALLAEFIVLPRLAGPRLEQHVTLHNPEVLEQALAEGRGALLVSGHLGNWEALTACVAAHFQPITEYGGQLHNPIADAFVNGIRRRMGVSIVGKQRGMRPMLRALKGGGVLAMAADQHFSRNRLFVRYFGKPVSAAPGLASLARHAGAPVVYAEALHVGRFRYRTHFERLAVPPRTDNEELDLLRITQAFFDRLEAGVRAHPEQYFWMHKRWRPPPTDEMLSETNRAFLAGEPPAATDGPQPMAGSLGRDSLP